MKSSSSSAPMKTSISSSSSAPATSSRKRPAEEQLAELSKKQRMDIDDDNEDFFDEIDQIGKDSFEQTKVGHTVQVRVFQIGSSDNTQRILTICLSGDIMRQCESLRDYLHGRNDSPIITTIDQEKKKIGGVFYFQNAFEHPFLTSAEKNVGEAVVKFPGWLAMFGNFRIKRIGSDGTEVETNKAMRYFLDLIENKFPTMFFVDKVPLKFNITRICANRMNEEEKKIFLNDLRDFPQHVAEAWRNNSASMKSNPNSNNSTPNAKRKNG